MRVTRVIVIVLFIGVLMGSASGIQAHDAPLSAAQSVGAPANPLGAQFAHIATPDNTTSNYTCLDHYATNGQPDALLFVTPDVQPGGIGGYVYDDHPIGVLYSATSQKWCIYNQDMFFMPQNAAFHVLVATAGPNAFIHTATADNTFADITYINSAATNDTPGAIIVVTPNASPPGGSAINNPHLIGLWYGGSSWGIYNLDGSAMPVGAVFNVLALPIADRPAFAHRSTAANVSGGVTYLNHPALNGHPNAIPFITQNICPGDFIADADIHPTGVWYNPVRGQWAITQLDITTMPVNAAFNVVIPSVDSAVFTHRATGLNISTDYTYFRHALTDNLPRAIVFATANWNPGGLGGVYHNHPIGVKFAPGQARWSVFNEDGVYMPTDPAFNVLIPVPDAGVFVHKAAAPSGSLTYLNHPLTNGRPNAILIVTPSWNPGGYAGVYNNHVIAVRYETANQRWLIINQDGAAMPTNAAFNVLVAPSGPGSGSTAFVHTATVGNTDEHITYIDHPATNGQPGVMLLVTPNYNPGGGSGVYNNHAIGVYYDFYWQKWSIFNQDLETMPAGASFNVLVASNRTYLPITIR